MGMIKKEYRVKMFCGFIYREENILSEARDMLAARFEKTDIEAGPFVFDFTDYYRKEMGEKLKRRFFSFTGLVSPDACHKWKIFTNKLEERFSRSLPHGRAINIDPGYMDMAKVVLLSTKDFFHRIYLDGGIFAELTMYYQKNDYRFLPWTYPDYRSEESLDFFRAMRTAYSQERGIK